jgi:hypothetical protein
MGTMPQLIVVSCLSVEIPLTVGFRPQLVVVSSLSVGIPLTVGFRLSQSLQLSWSPYTNFLFRTVEFLLSRSLSRTFLSHDGILAITEPFMKFFFHTMGFWLSQSLSRTFSFARWNFGDHGAFSNFHEFFTWWSSRDTWSRGRLFSYIWKRVFT